MSKYGRFNFASPTSDIRTWSDEPPVQQDPAEDELRRLRAELLTLKGTLADREMALAKAALETQQARDRGQRETQSALANAEQTWKAGEAARLAAAEAQWRTQSASGLAEAELRGLRGEFLKLKATLEDRETALAKAALDAQQARDRWQKESQLALAKAEQNWKAGEAARLAAAEAQWRQQSSALAEAELRGLRTEFLTLKATLADRETALVKATLDAQQARDRWQHEIQLAVANAEQTWKAGEAARLAAAEAQWRKQSASGLAEAMARCEAAETMVAQFRQEAAGAQFQQEAASDVIAGDLLPKSTIAEVELTHILSTPETEREPATEDSNIVIRSNRIWVAEALERKRRASRGPKWITAGAAAIALLGIIAYFGMGFLQDRQLNPTAITSALNALPTVSNAPAPAPAPAPSPPPAVAKDMAIIVRDVNVRANASTAAPVVFALSRGAKVQVIERRSGWALVRVEGEGANAKPRQGWAYGTFLKDA